MFSSKLAEINRGCVSNEGSEKRGISIPVVDKFEELLSPNKAPVCKKLSTLDAEIKDIPCMLAKYIVL